MRHLRRKLFVLIAIAAMLLPAIYSGAGATPAAQSIDELGDAISEYSFDRDELEQYSQKFGVSLKEADSLLLREAELIELVSPIVDEEPRLAAWGIEYKPLRAWIWLVDDEPLPSSLADLGRRVREIEFEFGATYTADQLKERARTVSSAMRNADIPDFTGVGISTRDNSVAVYVDPMVTNPDGKTSEVDPNSAIMAARVDAVRSEISEKLAENANVAIDDVIFKPLAQGDDGASVRGGQPIDGGCTTGFTVRLPWSASYDYGTLTAGHCTTSDISQGITMPVLASVASASRDIRLLAVPTVHTAIPKFWNGNANRRVHTAINPVFNQWLCHYGRTSGKVCGNVDDLNYGPSGGMGCPCLTEFVRVAALGCPGDSGGPVFRSHPTSRAAVGIYRGQRGANQCNPPAGSSGDYYYFGRVIDAGNTLSAIGNGSGLYGTVLIYF